MFESLNTLFVTLLLSYVTTGAAHAGAVEGRVVGISDGDTMTILTSSKERIRVRLAEIDAPESSQAFGARSKQALSDICFGKTATISQANSDRYGRVVSRVICDGVDAQSHMVGSGMAWVYDRYANDRLLYMLQDQAKSERRGLWSDPYPVPPWDFRRGADK